MRTGWVQAGDEMWTTGEWDCGQREDDGSERGTDKGFSNPQAVDEYW